MSRRPNPAADRAEQNRQTLKSLVKLEANKTCADCKRNKQPRWASWNIGIFICIRCSGIHRGMGTHISRVKSVDLDSWTDEQLQSMIKWGNARANRYWEAKLAPGHVPSENKIENFIRTKYESKRWVMDGGIPDPSTLDVADDDVPLKKVAEQAQIERSASQRLASSTNQQPKPAPAKPQPQLLGDYLFGDEPAAAPPRASTGPPSSRNLPPKAQPAPPKTTKAADSLLGLDLLGGSSSSQPARPSSTGPASSGPSRPDLKQSILSLYASAPKPAVQGQPQVQHHARQDSFGGLSSAGFSSPTQSSPPQQSSFGGMNDAFSSLSFNSPPPQASQPTPPPPKPSPFAGLDLYSSNKRSSSATSSMFGGGGDFFNSKAKSPPPASNSGVLGDFSSFTSPTTTTSAPKPAPASSGLGDLLDLSMPSTAPSAPSQSIASPTMNNAFNLSTPAAPAPVNPAPAQTAAPNYGFSNMDAWGGNDVWASSTTTQPALATTTTARTAPKSPGWGAATTPQVAQDDDWGGWSSAAPAASSTTATSTNKPSGGFSGGDDLFSNVWQ